MLNQIADKQNEGQNYQSKVGSESVDEFIISGQINEGSPSDDSEEEKSSSCDDHEEGDTEGSSNPQSKRETFSN